MEIKERKESFNGYETAEVMVVESKVLLVIKIKNPQNN